MKKICFLIGCVLTALMVCAEEPITILAPDTFINKEAYTLTDQGITISVSQGSAYPATHNYNKLGITYFACLANASITFSAAQNIKGIAIDGWVRKNFSATCDHGTLNYLSDDEDDTYGYPVLTISDINNPSVTISCDNQLRCFSVEVYFEENPEGPQGEIMDTVRFVAVTAQASDYSEDSTYSSEGHYSYWVMLAPQETYPQVWLSLYAAQKGDLSGHYSLYDFNVDEYTYVQLGSETWEYEYAYDQDFTITKTAAGYHIEGWIIADNDIQYEFVYDGPITIVGPDNYEEILDFTQDGKQTSSKLLRDGRLYIRRGDKTYNALGF